MHADPGRRASGAERVRHFVVGQFVDDPQPQCLPLGERQRIEQFVSTVGPPRLRRGVAAAVEVQSLEHPEPRRRASLDRPASDRHQQHVAGDAEEPGRRRALVAVLEPLPRHPCPRERLRRQFKCRVPVGFPSPEVAEDLFAVALVEVTKRVRVPSRAAQQLRVRGFRTARDPPHARGSRPPAAVSARSPYAPFSSFAIYPLYCAGPRCVTSPRGSAAACWGIGQTILWRTPWGVHKRAFHSKQCRPFRLARAPPNRKRPAGEARRFWGYYREERYVSLYMWIRGR